MYQICLSGAAGGKTLKNGSEKAYRIGQAVAKSGNMLFTGATIGLPYQAAKGAKAEGGMSVGFSPASTKLAHIKKYRLPVDAFDVVVYSGLHYVGRDVLLISSSDAVLFIGGRLGTLHEFTVSMELHKPIGVLLGVGGTTSEFKDVMKASGIRQRDNVIFDTDPERLVASLLKIVKDEHRDHAGLHRKPANKQKNK